MSRQAAMRQLDLARLCIQAANSDALQQAELHIWHALEEVRRDRLERRPEHIGIVLPRAIAAIPGAPADLVTKGEG